MFIAEPEATTKAFVDNDERVKVVFHIAKSIRDLALKNIDKEVSKESLVNCVEYIKDAYNIDFTLDEFNTILKLYPYQKCSLIEWGFDDTVVRESMGDIVANFLVNSRGLKHGDIQENDFSVEYYNMLKEIAKDFGYKTTEK